MVLEQLPPKRGGRLALQYLASPLVLGQTLQEQGIEGQDVTLSCTYVPTDMCAAWRYASGLFGGVEEEFALEGLTEMLGASDGEYLYNLPSSLENLTFGLRFNQTPPRSDLSKPSSKLDLGLLVQPQSGRSDLSKQSSKLDVWQCVQPEPERSDPFQAVFKA